MIRKKPFDSYLCNYGYIHLMTQRQNIKFAVVDCTFSGLKNADVCVKC